MSRFHLVVRQQISAIRLIPEQSISDSQQKLRILLGSIEPGKLADFFLVRGDPTEAIKTIALVARGGTFYYPGEVYPELGIRSLTGVPKITHEKN
ncbi:hypothetical protein [Cyclobacterium salsum]|uniref:hypothetical protein n=1 Tax=Cyclobacterium salsum TaxID=2666329 RepID=UPI00192E8429|nr:hypothetical protein [Cyclobacterium salsum]